MVVYCHNVTNIGVVSAQVFYGKQTEENTWGKSQNGSSFMVPGETERVEWPIGHIHDPLLVTTHPVDSQTLTWQINTVAGDASKLSVSLVSNSIMLRYRELGPIHIKQQGANLNLWVCNHSLVLENSEEKLGWGRIQTPFRFFLVTKEGITQSNDPGIMINYASDFH